jgi:hypothetical protein
MAACRPATAEGRVRLPLGASVRFASGCGKAWLIRLLREQEIAGSSPAIPIFLRCKYLKAENLD